MFRADKFDFDALSNDPGKSKSIYQQVDNAYEPMSENQRYNEFQCFKEFGSLDNMYVDVVSPLFQSCEDELRKLVNIVPHKPELNEPQKTRQARTLPASSFEILRKHGSRRMKLHENISNYKTQSNDVKEMALSSEMIIRLASEKFIHSSNKEVTALNHAYPCSTLGLSKEDSDGVQLIQNLLCCADKVGEQQYERAIKFLKECQKTSSCIGTPIQRLVFYFSEALFDKIVKETGRIIPEGLKHKPADPLEPVKLTKNILIGFQKECPLAQITKFVGVQCVIDHIGDATRVHVIDLEIRTGVQWIILMQALAARKEHPFDCLKITSTGNKLKLVTMEETGKQLTSFAGSLNLKFIYKIALVEDAIDLKESQLEVEDDEAVVVYMAYMLGSMVCRVDWLDHLMNVMKSINPCVMVVTEMEANCNSPVFIERFVESLFFFGAYFESLAECLKNNEVSRSHAESVWFRPSIRNMLAAEGEERLMRHVEIRVWRAFFARYGLVEVELSSSCIDQANMVLQMSLCGGSCTLYGDGKCLTIGWKSTPLKSVSAWKFE